MTFEVSPFNLTEIGADGSRRVLPWRQPLVLRNRPSRRCVDRITSYNVCYTKLLRPICRDPVAARLRTHYHHTVRAVPGNDILTLRRITADDRAESVQDPDPVTCDLVRGARRRRADPVALNHVRNNFV